jgi:hypothetical protein
MVVTDGLFRGLLFALPISLTLWWIIFLVIDAALTLVKQA